MALDLLRPCSPSYRRRHSPSPVGHLYGRWSRSDECQYPNVYAHSRRQQEAELKLIEEETAKRIVEAIRGRVEESLNNEEIKMEIKSRLEEGQRGILDEVATQLEKQKEAALLEA